MKTFPVLKTDRLTLRQLSNSDVQEIQGKGIMREAAEKVIEYSGQTLGIKTVGAYTHKDNQRSTSLLLELKFRSTNRVDEQNSNLKLYQLVIGINKD
jgi:ribosomal-protein-alanine N-acetyltransferase